MRPLGSEVAQHVEALALKTPSSVFTSVGSATRLLADGLDPYLQSIHDSIRTLEEISW